MDPKAVTDPTLPVIPVLLLEAWERVRAAELPGFCDQLQVKRTPNRIAEKRRFAALCWEMAGRVRGGRFFMGQLQAASLLDVDQSAVSMWVTEFMRLGWMDRVLLGDKWSGRASKYVWKLDTEQRK